ncbi:MAG: hypothetical protein ABIK28_23675, partial [Planctomycetota bacterium]
MRYRSTEKWSRFPCMLFFLGMICHLPACSPVLNGIDPQEPPPASWLSERVKSRFTSLDTAQPVKVGLTIEQAIRDALE